jgi:hypothetical protein
MLTWEELAEAISKLTPEERSQKAVVFSYGRDGFSDLTICVEGDPAFHVTIED